MNKEEYLSVLRRELMSLTPEDRNRWLDYYAELLDDAMEDGLSETEATASLGEPEALGERICREASMLLPRSSQVRGARAIPCTEEEGELCFEVDAEIHSLSAEGKEYDLFLVPSPDGVCRIRCPRDEYTHIDVAEADGLLWLREQDSPRPLLRSLFRSWNARITVELPSRELQELNAKTASGDVNADAALGFQVAQIQTASGDISFEAAAAILKLKTASGDIGLKNQAYHDLSAMTASGDVTLENITVQEKLRLETASGDVDLRHVVAAYMEVRLASGDLDGNDLLARDHLMLQTISGDVDISHLETGEAQVQTVSGEVEISVCSEKDFRVRSRSGDQSVPASLPGASLFAVQTVSGDISIEVDR